MMLARSQLIFLRYVLRHHELRTVTRFEEFAVADGRSQGEILTASVFLGGGKALGANHVLIVTLPARLAAVLAKGEAPGIIDSQVCPKAAEELFVPIDTCGERRHATTHDGDVDFDGAVLGVSACKEFLISM